jgi:hypothetical protein
MNPCMTNLTSRDIDNLAGALSDWYQRGGTSDQVENFVWFGYGLSREARISPHFCVGMLCVHVDQLLLQ